MTTSDINLIRFWAKTTHDKERLRDAYHPLICHLIDVAAVARAMWDDVLPDVTKRRLAVPFGLENDLDKAGSVIAFLAGLHDLGKCSPPFALRGKSKSESDQTNRLLALYADTACDCDRPEPAYKVPHGFVTAIKLPDILTHRFKLGDKFAKNLSEIIGGHHGIFPTGSDLQNIRNGMHTSQALGDKAWDRAREELVDALASILGVSINGALAQSEKLDNSTAMILAGFVSVADWIGSNVRHNAHDLFVCEVEEYNGVLDGTFTIDWGSYWNKSEQTAAKALDVLGWSRWPKGKKTMPKCFDKLFPEIAGKGLRDLQEKAVELGKQLSQDGPGICIIEALMGEGKTEAAMYLAEVFSARLGTRGIYFALPTQATSNQMFGRVEEFLAERFRGEDVDVQLMLAHGHASLSEEFNEKINRFENLTGIFDDTENEKTTRETANVVASEWFTRKKCGLLVPFGVGTIDQILLAALQTKHVFVRLFGLAHKVVIVDEVHAYDAYMSTLLERLLEWLAALGSPVIVLSATLPKARRTALMKAYLKGRGQDFDQGELPRAEGDADLYPRISYAHGGTPDRTFSVRELKTAPENTRTLRIEWKDEDGFVEELKAKLKHGGCGAIICNTVARAQQMYSMLKSDPFFCGTADDDKPKLDLLHARFRFGDRQEREKRALKRFGKTGSKVSITEKGKKVEHKVRRPDIAVLVSTQIIEQSLDLDFDLMISDLAPADLLLQRVGRLHRHVREGRPYELRNPALWILKPSIDEGGLPDFGTSKFVYDEHVLLRSWLEMKDCHSIKLPDAIEGLIEAVYDKKRTSPNVLLTDTWNKTRAKQDAKLAEKRTKAKAVRIAEYDDEDIFETFNFDLDENDPEKHRTLRALTRDEDRQSVSVVLLTHEESKLIGLEEKPNNKMENFLIVREVKISKGGLTQAILANAELKKVKWRTSPLLRHHRLIVLNEKEEAIVGDFKFRLDEFKGIVFDDGETNE